MIALLPYIYWIVFFITFGYGLWLAEKDKEITFLGSIIVAAVWPLLILIWLIGTLITRWKK